MPILVNENKSIIDGQHRLQAAKELKIPITYIISNESSEENIDQLQISKKWTAFDFCNRNALRGNKDCQKAIQIAEDWFIETNGKFSRINTITLLHNAKSVKTINDLKKNNYKIDLVSAIRIFNGLKILSLNNNPKFNPFTFKNSIVLKRMDNVLKGIDFKIIQKITKKNYLTSYTNSADQYTYLMDLYKKHK